jgi:hypothetical protein
MISGGNATIYVSNMDAAVRFYTRCLVSSSPTASETTGPLCRPAPRSSSACIVGGETPAARHKRLGADWKPITCPSQIRTGIRFTSRILI